MVTYLISAGYNSFHVALLRTLAVIFELSATWIAPTVMERTGPFKAGMWFLSWQMLWLGAAVSFFWAEPVSFIAASGLVAGTILSRVGLWGYDLCAQLIIQEVRNPPLPPTNHSAVHLISSQEVQGSNRGSFSSTEASLQNAFELLSYVSTIFWSRPEQFRYPVLLSAAAVFTSVSLFGIDFQRRRHLKRIPCEYAAMPQTEETQ